MVMWAPRDGQTEDRAYPEDAGALTVEDPRRTS